MSVAITSRRSHKGGQTIPVAPFRERFLQMEPGVRATVYAHDPKDAATLVALRLGWFDRGKPDGRRVRRVLGLSYRHTRAGWGAQERVRLDTARALCAAMDLDPVEVGL